MVLYEELQFLQTQLTVKVLTRNELPAGYIYDQK
jgi:hypothetical protein